MRNRNWDQDFEHINQSNVNRFSVNRDGQRQYDSGYHNNMGTTSFDRNMQDRNEWVNTSPDRYATNPDRYDYAPSYRQARADYDERRHLHNRNPGQNATNHGFMDRIGDFWHQGRERVEHLFDRFGNRQYNQGRDADRGYNQPDYYRNLYQQRNQQFRNEEQYRPSGSEGRNRNYPPEGYPNRTPRPGFENSPYYQGNQGQVQGDRYQSSDYSGRSSYRLLDTYSGYGQSGGSYASDRDGD